MTREEAIKIIRKEYLCVHRECDIEKSCGKCDLVMPNKEPILQAYKMAMDALKQKPCEDAVSREAVLKAIDKWYENNNQLFLSDCIEDLIIAINYELPSVQPKAKTGRCKECQYFEYDSVANVDGVPLIVAHEICSKWGDGCKTSENGYCFMFEQKGGAE